LDGVLEDLEADGIVVDERKPDVIRVAPTPLYNTFGDVWQFVNILWRSLEKHKTA
jgi:kynureninase